MRTVAASLLTTALALQLVSCQYTASPTVIIASGVLHGTSTTLPSATAAVNQFLGVPFAQSPPQRFLPPTPPQSWPKPRQVTNFTAACVQQFLDPPSYQTVVKTVFNNPGGPAPLESEDCLYLNVYAPSTPPPPGGRAVMFWIFGGAYEFGTAMQMGYDGSSMAYRQDVVVVVPNYRTNVFGFAGPPGVPLKSKNAGLLDQRMALHWVQQNIAHFGGDANKVTIFGESAGAASVDRLITSMPDNPPFRAAIMESGQATIGALKKDYTQSNNASWTSLVGLLNCTGSASSAEAFSCVQHANATVIKELIEQNMLTFGPVADNFTSLADPVTAWRTGRVAPVPVLEGTNSQEGNIFELGQQNLTQFLATTFANATQRRAVAALFPTVDPAAAYHTISDIYTQLTFTCPQAAHAQLARHTGHPVWRYWFDAAFNNTNPLYPVHIDLGVFHSSEIGLVFGTYPRVNVSAQEYALSNYMQAAWAAFAKDPRAGPGWNELGSLGGVDLAALGSNGTAGATMVRPLVADRYCDVVFPQGTA